MWVNNVNNYNYNQKNVTFGYQLDNKMFETWREDSLPRRARQIITTQGQKNYDLYLSSLRQFQDKRFDATEIVKEYWQIIKDLGDEAKDNFRENLLHLNFPINPNSVLPEAQKLTFKDIEAYFDLKKLDAELYLITDTNGKSKKLSCNLGEKYMDMDEEHLVSKEPPFGLNSATGVQTLEHIIDEKIEKNLRQKFDSIVREGQDNINEQQFSKTCNEICRNM